VSPEKSPKSPQKNPETSERSPEKSSDPQRKRKSLIGERSKGWQKKSPEVISRALSRTVNVEKEPFSPPPRGANLRKSRRKSKVLQDARVTIEGHNEALEKVFQSPSAMKKHLEVMQNDLHAIANGLTRKVDRRLFGDDPLVSHELEQVRSEIRAIDDTLVFVANLPPDPGPYKLRDLVHAHRGLGEQKLTPEQIAAGMQFGLRGDEILAYEREGLPINAITQPGRYTDAATVPGMERPLGSGVVGSVTLLGYQFADDTEPVPKAFKPEPPLDTIPDAAKPAGIITKLSRPDAPPPNFSGRAVAMSRLSNALRMGLVTQTDYAVHKGKLGIVMDVAGGQSPHVNHQLRITLPAQLAKAWRDKGSNELSAAMLNLGFTHAKLERDDVLVLTHEKPVPDADGHPTAEQEGLTIGIRQDFSDPLQWLDALCGQVDRTPRNYTIERWYDTVDGKRAVTACRIHAIDNDLSFGSKLLHGNDIAVPPGERLYSNPFNGAELPAVVDRDTYDALMALDADKLHQTLGGLITDEEIDATVSRLASIQAQLKRLEADGAILDTPEQWAGNETSKRLGISKDQIGSAMKDDGLFKALSMRSYLARDALVQEWMSRSLEDLDEATLREAIKNPTFVPYIDPENLPRPTPGIDPQ
jgi:hypothetical protein